MHTGIRLRVSCPAGMLMEADSDWLHMLLQAGSPVPDFADSGPPEPIWVPVLQLAPPADGLPAPLEIWIQAIMLPDDYPDDNA